MLKRVIPYGTIIQVIVKAIQSNEYHVMLTCVEQVAPGRIPQGYCCWYDLNSVEGQRAAQAKTEQRGSLVFTRSDGFPYGYWVWNPST